MMIVTMLLWITVMPPFGPPTAVWKPLICSTYQSIETLHHHQLTVWVSVTALVSEALVILEYCEDSVASAVQCFYGPY